MSQAAPVPSAARPARSGAIDALRHLLSIAVIVQHTPSLTRYSAEINGAIANVVTYIDGAVMGFFLLSGLFSTVGSQQGWLDDLLRQVRRLLLPFVLFSLVNGLALSALGKADIRQELIRLLTLQGSGPQLYFLPFLLLVWLFWRGLLDLARLARLPSVVALSAGIFALLALAVRFPTAAATGPEPLLLLLYAAAYGFGRVSQPLFRANRGASLLLACVAVPLAFGGQIDPRLADLAGVSLLAAAACELHSRGVLRGIGLPGSGGVYLMHTPIMNHAISTLLVYVGIASGSNVFATVILTYGLCVTMTLTAIGRWPQLRPWLLE